jgi:methylmalonyl-CoA/ethylmalonyl-CoA epimerase
MSISIHHVAIAVHDIDEALTLYRDGLGLQVCERGEVPEDDVEIARMPTDAGGLELVAPIGRENSTARFLRRRGEGLHHVCLATDDLEGAMKRLQAAGAQLVGQKPRAEGGRPRLVFVHPKDAHGVLLELYEV